MYSGSHCGSNLHFPGDLWGWASFHVLIYHLDIFFGEVTIQIFCCLKIWVIYFLFVCSLYILDRRSLSDICFATVVFSVCSLSLYFINSTFQRAVLTFDEVRFVNLLLCGLCFWYHIQIFIYSRSQMFSARSFVFFFF